jgi:ribosomal protein L11 methyltransferase
LLKLSQIRFRASENTVPLFSDFLLGLGSLGVAEDMKENGIYEISAYFPMETDLSSVMSSLRDYSAFIRGNVKGARTGSVEVEHIDRSSWEVWRTLLKKVHAGKRIVIVPPWEEHAAGDGEIVIEINPSLAFGTGHHETTRLCISYIEEVAEKQDARSMLDVGCGSGILAISAYKLGIENVTGFDTDPIAVRESRRNAERNSVLDKIKFFCGSIQSAASVCDLIVANVYLEPIYHMREEFKSRLAAKGTLVVSGIPYVRRDEAVDCLIKAGFKLEKQLRDGDWVALGFSLV